MEKFDKNSMVNMIQEALEKNINQDVAQSVANLTSFDKRLKAGIVDQEIDSYATSLDKAVVAFSSKENLSNNVALYSALAYTFGADLKPPYDDI